MIALRVAVEYSKSKRIDPLDETDRPYNGLSCDQIKNSFTESSIKIFLVEEDKEKFDRLVENAKQVITKYDVQVASYEVRKGEHFLVTGYGEVTVGCHLTNKSFEEEDIPKVKQPSERMISYIDPFDYKISFEQIQNLVGEGKEVFITSNVNTIQNLTNHEIDTLHGLPGGNPDNIKNLLKLYEENLKKETVAKYSLPFEVRKKTTSLFHAIFASRSEDGFIAIKEAIYGNSKKKVDAFSLSDYNIIVKEDEINLKNGQSAETVKDVIFNKFKGQPNITPRKIKHFIIHDTHYVWRKEPLILLERKKKIDVRCNGQLRKRKNTFPDELLDFMCLDFKAL